MYDLPSYTNLLRNLGTSPGGGEPGVGTPGFANYGDTTGIGNLSPGEAASAAARGFSSGLVGQIGGPALGTGAKAASLALSLAGVPTFGFGPINSFLGMLYGLANSAEASTGKVAPETFSEAAARMGNPANWFADPNQVPLGPPAPIRDFGLQPEVPEPPSEARTFYDEPDPNPEGDDGTGGGIGSAGGPTAGPDAGTVGDYFRGGMVRGPAGRDRIPAHLTRGEYVLNADSARHFLGVLDQINRWHAR